MYIIIMAIFAITSQPNSEKTHNTNDRFIQSSSSSGNTTLCGGDTNFIDNLKVRLL
ncbi:MAG: hypothetical protein K2P53_01050 [Rickettsiales bacterium]|jgi:hypothetical protein|nr:hypothetical protein [Rickettsiales bacterium]